MSGQVNFFFSSSLTVYKKFKRISSVFAEIKIPLLVIQCKFLHREISQEEERQGDIRSEM
jgi:hypothetical protein